MNSLFSDCWKKAIHVEMFFHAEKMLFCDYGFVGGRLMYVNTIEPNKDVATAKKQHQKFSQI